MKIGLLTAFSQLIGHYSLTRVVLDQAWMIRNAGHDPVLIALRDFSSEGCPSWLEVRAALPVYRKTDYRSAQEVSEEHREVAKEAAAVLCDALRDMDAVFTHDICFTGWNLPINMALHLAAPRIRAMLLHWVHSVPGGGFRDYWRIPAGGKVVFPNHADRLRCAAHFGLPEEDVLVIPHSLDPRRFLMQTALAKAIVTDFDVLSAEMVQTYPVPTDRMEHKGLEQVIILFGLLKEQQRRSVRLIVCNSWCTTDGNRRKVEAFRAIGRKCGLTDRELIFTSVYCPALEEGVPNEVIRDLMAVSNLFICPTKSETFGFTISEAALTGQLLVLNSNVPCLPEISGPASALYLTFGSLQQAVDPKEGWAEYYREAARRICHRFDTDAAIQAKTRHRREYNADAVWRKIEAALAECAAGVKEAV